MEKILTIKLKKLQYIEQECLNYKNYLYNIEQNINFLKNKSYLIFKEKVKLYNTKQSFKNCIKKNYQLQEKKNKLIRDISDYKNAIKCKQEINNKITKLNEYKLKCIEKYYINEIIKYIYKENEQNVIYNSNIIYDDYMLSLMKKGNIVFEN